MSLPHRSIQTISAPEFINLQPLDINPLMSSCDIKVLYLGQNRNRVYIDKETAITMSKTLRGAPIVGYYKKEKEDFADHGEQIVIEGSEIKFNTMTKPYGYVSPDAKVWFQDFEDFDEFGNSIVRTYLMTTGYLWTGQFQEVKKVFEEEGKPQSMELDEQSLNGHWSTDIKNDMDFFIISDAIFSKLCILGDDVEPCFQGASITAPDISTSFTVDKNFKQTLFSMMEELKEVLKEGGNKNVADVKKEFEKQQPVEDSMNENNSSFEAKEKEEKEEKKEKETSFEANKKEEEKEKEENNKETEKNDEEDSNSGNEQKENKEDEQDKKRYSLLEEKYETLKKNYSLLEQENKELKEFKNKIEDQEKDNLINEFYMLSEEDKKEIIENKSNYSLDEIKSKLAVICFDKKISFDLNNDSKEKSSDEPETLFTLNVEQSDNTPDWVKAVELTMSNMNNY